MGAQAQTPQSTKIMPPRKKTTKGSVRAASSPVVDEDAMSINTPKAAELAKPSDDITKDPWTDEQETSLYKGIIKWKPAGMHKHFRMIALSEHLRNHGYDPNIDQHTRIPGIWEKLRKNYNLDIIDDRENFEVDDQDKFLDFKLPEEDFDELTFMRGKRGPSEAPSSPPSLTRSPSPRAQRKRKRADTAAAEDTRASTVDDTDEAASSPPRATRAGNKSNKSMGRVKAETGSRQQSKDMTADTADEETGGEVTEDATDNDDHEGEADEDEEAGTPSTRPSRRRPKGTISTSAATTRRGRRKR